MKASSQDNWNVNLEEMLKRAAVIYVDASENAGARMSDQNRRNYCRQAVCAVIPEAAAYLDAYKYALVEWRRKTGKKGFPPVGAYSGNSLIGYRIQRAIHSEIIGRRTNGKKPAKASPAFPDHTADLKSRYIAFAQAYRRLPPDPMVCLLTGLRAGSVLASCRKQMRALGWVVTEGDDNWWTVVVVDPHQAEIEAIRREMARLEERLHRLGKRS